jgi:uracil-DNA glycosylase
MTHDIKIEESRKLKLQDEFSKSYFQNIIDSIKKDKAERKIIYPQGGNIFRSFELTPWDEVKVVILGQDPYHGAGQAHGLSFSVPEGIMPPPSLINIFKEIQTEYPEEQIDMRNGNLTPRAQEWVLLLNAFLTVQAANPLSHSKIGWETFTDQIISLLSSQKQGLVFMLWWGFAKSKSKFIDSSKHLLLTASHPSPLAANQGGWFGNNHFRLCNEYLEKQGKKAINRSRT